MDATVRRRGPVTSAIPRWVAPSVLSLAAVLLAVTAERVDRVEVGSRLADLVVGLTFFVAAMATASRYRGTCVLLASTGAGWFLGNFDADWRFLYRGPLVHACMTYVGARPRTRLEWTATVVGYVAAVAVGVWSHDTTAMVLSGALVACAIARVVGTSGRSRRDRTIALVATSVFAFAVVVVALATRLNPRTLVDPMLLFYDVGLSAMAVLLSWNLRTPKATQVMDLVVELSESAAHPSGTLRDALAAVLHDPQLEVGYLSEQDGEYRDEAGRRVDIPPLDVDRSATFLHRGGSAFAVLVHERSLLDDPATAEAVAVAARLSSTNEALLEELRTQLDDVARARRRLIAASDAERRLLTSRLHDTVERRVIDVSACLHDLTLDGEAARHLDRAQDHLESTLGDLDRLSRGLHPRELGDGLHRALASLVAATPLPVELIIDEDPAMSEDATASAYFVCTEALGNVAKHANAHAVTISVVREQSWLRISVRDDGIGGADPAHGSGLSGLHDRVAALGGRMTITSPPGGGTRVEASLPLAD